MTILLFLAVLFVLILVHEWGHFIAAKKTGMRVDEFGIGFPPKLFGVKKGETEYTLNAFPIGGFVRIYGENAEDAAADAAANKDIARSFIARPKWAQAVVLVAGVVMNVVFAWFLFILVFTIGIPTSVDESVANEEASMVIASVIADSPAAEAGLRPGDEIVSVKRGEQMLSNLKPSSFSSFTKESTDDLLVTTANGETYSVAPTTGVISGDEEALAVGVSLTMVEDLSMTLPMAMKEATVTTFTSLGAITVGIFNLIVDSFRGTADLSQVAGPVGIVGLVGDAAQFGLTSLLMFTAVISLNLAVINMLPFPALDGGRLLFVAIETLTKRDINPVWVARLNLVGFVVLISLMLLVTYSDVLKLI